jgi:uncharacterized membrane protein YkoI
MNRRNLLTLLCALALLQPNLAIGEDGEDDGGGDSDDGGSDDDSGSDDNSESGDDHENPDADDGDHDDALRAVETDGALSLEDFLRHFRRQLKGRVVDVSLSRRSDTLIFLVTFVDPDNRVRRQKFNARTGDLIH